MATNKFDQLVEDLVSGELGLTHVQMAIRESVRRRKDIPDGIKDILAGKEGNAGLIYRQFSLISNMIGAMELAFRRGEQPE